VKFGRYLVQFIVWVGIPIKYLIAIWFGCSSEEQEEHLKMEWELLVWRKLEHRRLICLFFVCLLYRRDFCLKFLSPSLADAKSEKHC